MGGESAEFSGRFQINIGLISKTVPIADSKLLFQTYFDRRCLILSLPLSLSQDSLYFCCLSPTFAPSFAQVIINTSSPPHRNIINTLVGGMGVSH